MINEYHNEEKEKDILKLRELIKEMPPFSSEFFRSIESSKSTKTQLGYCYDLKLFFDYLEATNSEIRRIGIKQISIKDIERIESVDVEEYISYLSLYYKKEKKYTNDNESKARKLSSLRCFYGYYYKRKMIKQNPTLLVDMPKISDKTIIKLDNTEMYDLINEVESGALLQGKAIKYHEKNKARDMAIVILLLGTGIRVSECVGLNTTDIDFSENKIKITRKGGKEKYVYFNAEVESYLTEYIENHRKLFVLDESLNALFLSQRGTRLTTRSIEKLIKKYSSLISCVKHITPHKLRSTFGTNLYNQTGDIYLVAESLGHRDVNTTKKHYADMSAERLKEASSLIKLR